MVRAQEIKLGPPPPHTHNHHEGTIVEFPHKRTIVLSYYWKHALDALINVFLYYMFITKFFCAILALILEYEIRRKTQLHVWKVDMIPSHASKTSSCIDDDHVFLVMAIVRMLSIKITTCYQNNNVG